MPEPDPETRLVPMTKEQYELVARAWQSSWPTPGDSEPLGDLAGAYEAAPADYWDQIAEEFRKHRCKDPDCFTESVLMRLGVISYGNLNSPFGF